MLTSARRDAARLADLLRSEHHAMADFLLALSAFDESRGWAELGHANLWAFLHRQLGLSAGAAHHRKVASGLVRRFPSVEGALRDGRLCLSSVVELARVLTPENQVETLPRFFRRSAREAREVVAELMPREAPPVRDLVTPVDRPRPEGAGFHTSESPAPAPPCPPAPALVTPVVPSNLATAASTATPRALAPPSPARSATSPPRDDMEPLTADLRRLHVTVSRRFLQKLDAVRAARSHAHPGATTEALLEEALDLLLEREARRREGASGRPLAQPRAAAPDHVSASVRRAVWARDGGCCQCPLDSGGTCGSTHQVELDHQVLRCRGGPPTAANLRLLCKAHNLEAARQELGEAWMGRFVEGRGTGVPSARPVTWPSEDPSRPAGAAAGTPVGRRH